MAHLSHDCLVDCPRARHTIAHTYSSGVASRTPRPRIASLPSSSLAHVLSWSLSREYTYLRARLHAFACAAPALWTTTSSYWSTTPPTPPLAPTSSCGARASSVSNPLTMRACFGLQKPVCRQKYVRDARPFTCCKLNSCTSCCTCASTLVLFDTTLPCKANIPPSVRSMNGT